MSVAIGMMDAGYFVGRKEIVEWINDTLKLNLMKVEQTASGAVACQLLDSMFPGAVALHKVNWEAKQEYAYIQNYKVLQNAFDKLKIDKNVEVEKLIKGKYQDNLEFMQWFKRFYEINHSGGDDYDAVAQRQQSRGGNRANDVLSNNDKAKAHHHSITPVKGSTATSVDKKPRPRALDDKENARRPGKAKSPAAKADAGAKHHVTSSRPSEAKAVTMKSGQAEELQRKVESLSHENAELRGKNESLLKERDFYFDKLTMIEELMQEKQSTGECEPALNEVMDQVFKILYATTGPGEEQPLPDSNPAIPEEAETEPQQA